MFIVSFSGVNCSILEVLPYKPSENLPGGNMTKEQEGNIAEKKKGVIIVTGSSGRIGASLVARLGEKYRIVGFELVRAIYASSNEELVPVDISSEESMQQAFNHIRDFYGTHITAVIHLAAYYSFSDPSYEKYKKITVEGTRRLLDILQDFTVEQFIFSSTMLLHKPSNKKIIKENSPLSGRWAYPRSKIETEEVIHKHRGKIPTVILRISGVYDDICHSIPISNQIQRIYEKQFIRHFFPGRRSSGAPYLHMDDLIDALCMCVEKRKKLPKETTLLLTEPLTMSIDQLQRKISWLIHGREMKTWRIPKFLAYIGAWVQCHIPFCQKPFIRPWMIRLADENYRVDISKAKRVLGWEPKKRLDDELEIMIDFLKEDPHQFYAVNDLQAPKHFEKQWKRRLAKKPKSKR